MSLGRSETPCDEHQLPPYQEGFWMIRLGTRMPETPATIAFQAHEPDNPENLLDRYPPRSRRPGVWIAGIAGESVDPITVWERVCTVKHARPITRTEYDYQLMLLRHRQRWVPEHPTVRPHKPVDVRQLPLPTFPEI